MRRTFGRTASGAAVNRFLLFAGEHYYPRGGWEDWRGRFETLDEAKAAFLAWRDGRRESERGDPDVEGHHTWGHIVDDREGEIVSEMWSKHVTGGPGWSDEIIARSESAVSPGPSSSTP